MQYQHPPCAVLQALLVQLGFGVLPSSQTGVWPIYTDVEPGQPDNVITVYDDTNVVDASEMISGVVSEHHGWQVRVRSQKINDGKAKARDIANAMDLIATAATPIALDLITYTIVCINRTTGINAPQPVTGSSLRFFTINGTMAYRT